ncbi:hypothetical protein [Suttonella ornithocola]|uniref:Uncharacterized protein n=1 Tax=Suttonella ornithocola TaxID=279832 RepID=A0A380MPE6_9GAMM|nr:hypothetical protein [Suttonella ornithocola]SUO94148.1 Uncharacterised protein [Suttonella ornithocola]
MSLKITNLNQKSYYNTLQNIILRLEEQGTVSTTPYLDSKNIPTIGIGFNLRENYIKDIVLPKVIGKPPTDNKLKNFNNVINKNFTDKNILVEKLNNFTSKINKNSEFKLSNTQIDDIFENIIKIQESEFFKKSKSSYRYIK